MALKAVDLRPALRDLRARSATPAGQATGVALILVPAIVHPVPLGSAGAAVEVAAAFVGALGALVVFGGLFQWVFLDLGDGVRGVPHVRWVWTGAVLLAAVLAAGAVWRLVLTTGDTEGHLAEAAMLGLPALALVWAAWATRGIWSDDGAGAPLGSGSRR